MKAVLFALVLFAALPALASAASPRAWLDRDSIRLGETVTLNIEVEGMTGDEPDFTLLDADFQRIGVSSRTQMSLVNGQRTVSTLWAVALEPREAGVFTLPAIPVGTSASNSLRLTVMPAATATAGQDVFLEVEAMPGDPYVQQQVRYRIKLHYAVTLLDGQLDEPSPAGAEMRRLGNDLSYQTQIGALRYNVVERRFALIPEASGELLIPAVRFRGRAMGSSGRFGPGLSSGRQVSASSEPIRLQVKPNPPGSAQPWLPASQLELAALGDTWPESVMLGEPLSLELRIAARGVDGARLPELALPQIDGVDVYPDQPVMRSGEDGEWVQGERRQRFALVPQRAGDVVLPEITLAWWNTETDRAETATIPARRIRVLPAADSVAGGEAEPAASGVPQPAPVASAWPWQMLSAALLVAWLVTLALWWRQRHAGQVAPAAQRPCPSGASLRGAILRRSPQDFESALISLARHAGEPAGTVGDVANRLDDLVQRAALQQYLQSRWRAGEVDWSDLGKAFARLPVFSRRVDNAAEHGHVLPPLYPPR